MSDIEHNGGPAFPNPALANESWQGFDGCEGLSVRDYFAGRAIAGVIVACAQDTLPPNCTRVEYLADQALQIADAMLEARKGDTS